MADTSGYDGTKCALKDGYNRNAAGHHYDWLMEKVVNSPDFKKGGWQVALVSYDITGIGGPDHTNIQLLRPDGSAAVKSDQNGRMVTSIDLWSLDRKNGDATFYASGERFTSVLDDCKPDNFVVLDKKEEERAVVKEGTGAEVLKAFLTMAEFAGRANRAGLTYEKFPNAKNGGFNSNSLPKAAILAAGEKYPDIFEEKSGGDSFFDTIPGKDRGEALLHKVMDGQPPLYFAGVPASDITNPKHAGAMADVLNGLSLRKQQYDVCVTAGNTKGCVVSSPTTP